MKNLFTLIIILIPFLSFGQGIILTPEEELLKIGFYEPNDEFGFSQKIPDSYFLKEYESGSF